MNHFVYCFIIIISSIVVTTPTTAETSIRSSSRAGQLLLQKAQRVLNGNENNNNADYSYIAEYSIKFQGCHHVQQWNDNVDEENDVRIMTKRLARFRLCPTDQCSNDKSSGCTTKYGDYIVDVRVLLTHFVLSMGCVLISCDGRHELICTRSSRFFFHPNVPKNTDGYLCGGLLDRHGR